MRAEITQSKVRQPIPKSVVLSVIKLAMKSAFVIRFSFSFPFLYSSHINLNKIYKYIHCIFLYQLNLQRH